MSFCHVTHSIKRIEILLSHISDNNNFKIGTLYFLWFNVSRLLFVTFYTMFQNYNLFHLVQSFKTFPLSHTQKSLCIFIHHFHFYSFIYTCPQPFMSCHLISNTLKKKMMLFTFSLSTTPT